MHEYSTESSKTLTLKRFLEEMICSETLHLRCSSALEVSYIRRRAPGLAATAFLSFSASPKLPIKITIKMENCKLVGQGDRQPSFPLTCYEPNNFKNDQAMLKLEFILSETKITPFKYSYQLDVFTYNVVLVLVYICIDV